MKNTKLKMNFNILISILKKAKYNIEIEFQHPIFNVENEKYQIENEIQLSIFNTEFETSNELEQNLKQAMNLNS